MCLTQHKYKSCGVVPPTLKVIITMKVPQNECHVVKASNSQHSIMDHVLPLYYVSSLEWLVNFISCNKHKDDSI